MKTTDHDISRRIAPRCHHTPRCPAVWQPDALDAVIIASRPEQGWHLLCNGIITFDDTGAIVGERVIAPRRAAPGTGCRGVRAQQRGSLADSATGNVMHALIEICLGGIVIIICLGLYLLPTLIALIRRAPDTATVVVLNVLLGWTLFCWVVCLALALRKPPPSTSVNVISHVNLPSNSPGDRAA